MHENAGNTMKRCAYKIIIDVALRRGFPVRMRVRVL